MRPVPSRPDPAVAAEWRGRIASMVEAGAALRAEALRRRQASFFAERAGHLAAAADAEYLFDGEPRRLTARLREAVSEFLLSLELGRVAPAAELRGWFHAAVAAGDRNGAHAMAALPRRCWYGADIPRLQVACGFALLRSEQGSAEKHLETLKSLTLEQPLPADLQPAAAEHASWCAVFEGLVRRQASAVVEGLRRRAEARAAVEGPPFALDLEGSGIQALAELRSLPLPWSHVTMPRLAGEAPAT